MTKLVRQNSCMIWVHSQVWERKDRQNVQLWSKKHGHFKKM